MIVEQVRSHKDAATEIKERIGLMIPTPAHDADNLVLAQSSVRSPLNDTSEIAW